MAKKVFFFLGHPTGAYGRKRQKAAVVDRVSFVFCLCKSTIHALNVVHLKRFIIELPCFVIHLKYRNAESPKAMEFQ